MEWLADCPPYTWARGTPRLFVCMHCGGTGLDRTLLQLPGPSCGNAPGARTTPSAQPGNSPLRFLRLALPGIRRRRCSDPQSDPLGGGVPDPLCVSAWWHSARPRRCRGPPTGLPGGSSWAPARGPGVRRCPRPPLQVTPGRHRSLGLIMQLSLKFFRCCCCSHSLRSDSTCSLGLGLFSLEGQVHWLLQRDVAGFWRARSRGPWRCLAPRPRHRRIPGSLRLEPLSSACCLEPLSSACIFSQI